MLLSPLWSFFVSRQQNLVYLRTLGFGRFLGIPLIVPIISLLLGVLMILAVRPSLIVITLDFLNTWRLLKLGERGKKFIGCARAASPNFHTKCGTKMLNNINRWWEISYTSDVTHPKYCKTTVTSVLIRTKNSFRIFLYITDDQIRWQRTSRKFAFDASDGINDLYHIWASPVRRHCAQSSWWLSAMGTFSK